VATDQSAILQRTSAYRFIISDLRAQVALLMEGNKAIRNFTAMNEKVSGIVKQRIRRNLILSSLRQIGRDVLARTAV
jgi:hypothetical protein